MTKQKLEARGLCFSYEAKTIVHDVNMVVSQGEIRGVLGPNGAGKSTTFNMLAGIVPPKKGAIYLSNIDITSLSLAARAQQGVSYLPQDASIFQGLTVAENIYAVLELSKKLSKDEKQARLESLLEEFELAKIRNNLGVSVSGGERRRVEVARAVALEPKFLLLDEPFAGIDPLSISEITEVIFNVRAKGVGVLITDHNVRETLEICDTADILHAGTIIASGKPAEIIASPQVQKVYLGDSFVK
tara:strand:+ start:1098 stop:1829 length:732 start_codon:yes stop_codon:yes gene_type:complete